MIKLVSIYRGAERFKVVKEKAYQVFDADGVGGAELVELRNCLEGC